MSRLGRIVAAGFPHHVTQRGNRRQTIFFEPADYALYRDLLAERCRKAFVGVSACRLMPNRVHLVFTPSTPDGLARAIDETHRQYLGQELIQGAEKMQARLRCLTRQNTA